MRRIVPRSWLRFRPVKLYFEWTGCFTLLPFFFGFHDPYSVQWLTDGCEKIRCRRCERIFALNHRMGAVLPWDKKMAEFYAGLERDIERALKMVEGKKTEDN